MSTECNDICLCYDRFFRDKKIDDDCLSNKNKRKFEDTKITEDDDEIVIRIKKKRKLNDKSFFFLLISQLKDNEVFVQYMNTNHPLFNNLIKSFKSGNCLSEENEDCPHKEIMLYKIISSSSNEADLKTIEIEDSLLQEYREFLDIPDLKLSDFKGLVDDMDRKWMNNYFRQIRSNALLDNNILVMDSWC